MARLVLAVTTSLMLVGCGSEEPSSVLELDVRSPDDEGVVTEVTLTRLVLDDDRIYDVSPLVESFIATTKKPAAILSTDGRYVQVGVDEQRDVIWISTVGVVARSDPPQVLYTGHYLKTDERGRAVFRDGTVLKLKKGIKLPPAGKQVSVRLDPKDQQIVEFLGV